jgi:hypothetical protein
MLLTNTRILANLGIFLFYSKEKSLFYNLPTWVKKLASLLSPLFLSPVMEQILTIIKYL